MKFLAIIPARYGSSRFPGKPLALIQGKTMIEHVYSRVSAVFEECWVATDDTRISEAVETFGGRWVMTDNGHRSGTDRCAEALEITESTTGTKFDVVINVQGDEPFITSEHLCAVKRIFFQTDSQIGTLIKSFEPGEQISNPNSPKVVISNNGRALYFSRSIIPYIRDESDSSLWQGSTTFYKHIGLYGYRSAVLREITALGVGDLERAESLEQLRWLENGYTIQTAIVESATVAVDTPQDLERINSILENQ